MVPWAGKQKGPGGKAFGRGLTSPEYCSNEPGEQAEIKKKKTEEIR